jgi:integrase/recombinase XerC
MDKPILQVYHPVVGAWIQWLGSPDAPRRLTRSTISIYSSKACQFVDWLATMFEIEVTPSSITAYRMEQYLAWLEQQQRAPSTQNVAVAALRLLAQWLTATNLRSDNPARRLHAQPEQLPPPRTISHRVMRRIIDAAHGDEIPLRDTLVIELLSTAGLRASEVAAIQIEHLEYGRRTTWIKIIGKRHKVRRIPIPKAVGQVLQAYLAQRGGNTEIPTMGPLFVGQRGPITRTTINRIVTTIVARARLTDEERASISPHSFRHTVATYVARRYSLVQAGDLLGHRSLNTTRRYTQSTVEELEAIAEGITYLE